MGSEESRPVRDRLEMADEMDDAMIVRKCPGWTARLACPSEGENGSMHCLTHNASVNRIASTNC
jgi:hypothetical protein